MYEEDDFDVPVAQLDRVLASDAKGRGFEPLRVRHFSKSRFSFYEKRFFMASRTVEPGFAKGGALILKLLFEL